jgi:carboxymethylenebutenolidase
MRERALSVNAADGQAEGFLYTPDGGGPWPGVIFLTDVWGIRPGNQGMALRLAAQGYAVLMPNIFYRSDRLPIVEGEPDSSRPAVKARLEHLLGALTAEMMLRDGPAYADFLLQQPEVRGPKLAVLGYCFTGQFALRIAAMAPDRISAAASFHGGWLVTDKPDSPHTLLPRVTAELYFGHAVEDASMPAAAIERLDDALKGWGGRYQSEIYDGARHGWSVPGRPVYNPMQSERHFQKLFDLLQRNLG